MSCTTSCLMIPKKRLPLEGKPPNFTIIRSREHCIVDCIMGSCFAAYHKKRHMRYWKKRMTAYVEPINLVQNLGIDSKDWDIIGLRWSLTSSLMPNDVTPAKFMAQAPGYLHFTTSTWPFEMWGMDVIGHISLPSSKGHRFILVITDYFSKWADAIPLREVKSSDVIQFVKHHVIYRFDVPRRIVHDNGPQFVSQAFQRFCTKFRI